MTPPSTSAISIPPKNIQTHCWLLSGEVRVPHSNSADASHPGPWTHILNKVSTCLHLYPHTDTSTLYIHPLFVGPILRKAVTVVQDTECDGRNVKNEIRSETQPYYYEAIIVEPLSTCHSYKTIMHAHWNALTGTQRQIDNTIHDC